MSDDEVLSSASGERDVAWEALVELEIAVLAGNVMRVGELLRQLATHGENLETVLSSIDNEGQSLLHKLAATEPTVHSLVQSRAATALLLVEASAHLGAENSHGETALLLASRAAADAVETQGEASIDKDVRLAMVSCLLSMRADPNTGDLMDETPLMEAACAGDIHLCTLLLDSNADAMKVSRSGLIALDFSDSYPEIAQLLKTGPRREVNGVNGESPGEAAKADGQYAGNARTEWAMDLLQAALEHQGARGEKADAAVKALQIAVDADEGAVSCGVALQSRNRDGRLLLQLCQVPTKEGTTAEAVKWLIHAEADVNVTNAMGETPLALAVRASCNVTGVLGGALMVSSLLQARANPNRGNERGETPLMDAVCSGDAKMCSLLLDAGAEALVSEDYRI
mmetsp:Transcript_139153/g.242155  ORF Transcript_139153/g.242155 Transcript_139153/m.242155 type:complete len:399 (+) Transcript_139153:44-1240(+)